ncbi:rho GTPase-activating protein 45-like [Marmota marmota marmota]|uniref:rho GTPase-activating protein 45-like n=1 Tax=Marmota marmota marmota TaxID=9994 RepID=UPI0007625FA7|nr:rho GTPase-activating protein 45-like [Marmota marmota marmota]
MLGRRWGTHASYSPHQAGWQRSPRTDQDLGIRLMELPKKDGVDVVFPGPSLEPPAVSSGAKATGTLKRPTSLSRHASAAGFPLSGAASWTLGRGYRSPLTASSPAELPAEGPGPDAVEDISNLLADVARFAEGLEKLKECVVHDGESPPRQGGQGGGLSGRRHGQKRKQGGTWGRSKWVSRESAWRRP